MAHNDQYAVVSLFSGAGGLDLGVEQSSRAKVVWAMDIDPVATATYRRNLGNHVWTGDISELEQFPNVPCDILVGGPPCQDFSEIGPREGLGSERGKHFREMTSFLDTHRPAAFVFENVPGLLSANQGAAWTWVRFGLKAPSQFLGRQGTEDWPTVRYDIWAQKVDFSDFGVPQRRQRVVVMGMRRDLAMRIQTVPRPFAAAPTTVEEAFASIPSGAPNHRIRAPRDSVATRMRLIRQGENYSAIPEDHEARVSGGRSHAYRRLRSDAPAHTVIARGGGGTVPIHPTEHRNVTDRELAALQGFPHDYVFVEKKAGDARRQIGNAVPPPAGKALITALADALQEAGVPGRSEAVLAAARQEMARLSPTPQFAIRSDGMLF